MFARIPSMFIVVITISCLELWGLDVILKNHPLGYSVSRWVFYIVPQFLPHHFPFGLLLSSADFLHHEQCCLTLAHFPSVPSCYVFPQFSHFLIYNMFVYKC